MTDLKRKENGNEFCRKSIPLPFQETVVADSPESTLTHHRHTHAYFCPPFGLFIVLQNSILHGISFHVNHFFSSDTRLFSALQKFQQFQRTFYQRIRLCLLQLFPLPEAPEYPYGKSSGVFSCFHIRRRIPQVDRFRGLIEENLSDAELSVEELGSRMGLSRVQLYRKIKALTNYSPNELVRIARLKKAASLLASSEKTISEITYEVGFTSPSYFTKCYKEYFGESPTDFLKRRG